MEKSLSKLLIGGVALAALMVLVGGIWYVTDYGQQRPDYSHFAPSPASYRAFSAVFEYIAEGQSQGIIQLGLLLLIATPVARVLFSLILFAKSRDYMYCGITAVVLGVLLYALLGTLP